ncbi:hypothetical protein AaE_002713 [Aphanomyces astaci]|uniref:NYN domain-containing protein n=2 Tax=Aphanomyces astaci TaxID=112090 RepID=A0A6A5AP42_APHAT|nr:hypothetical protein AaE_002713 [Aphanomyces astaci]
MRLFRSIPHSFDWDIDASAEVLRLMSEAKYARSIAVQGGDTTANVLMCGNQVKAIHGFVKEDTSWNVLHFLAQERAFLDHVVNVSANLECFPDLAMEMKVPNNWNARGKDTIIFDHILGTAGGELQPATSGPVICVKWTCFAKLLSTCEITNGVSIQPDLKWWKSKALPEPRRTVMLIDGSNLTLATQSDIDFAELLDEIQMRLQESISGVFTTMDDEFIMFPEVHWFDDVGMDESIVNGMKVVLPGMVIVKKFPMKSKTIKVNHNQPYTFNVQSGVDAGIAYDMGRLQSCDHLILATGDGDFAAPVAKLRNVENMEVTVLSTIDFCWVYVTSKCKLQIQPQSQAVGGCKQFHSRGRATATQPDHDIRQQLAQVCDPTHGGGHFREVRKNSGDRIPR